MSNKTKQLKLSLVQARKTIAKKFRKLHNERVDRERDLEEKFAPITNSINKLIDTKKLLSSEGNRKNNDNAIENDHILDVPIGERVLDNPYVENDEFIDVDNNQNDDITRPENISLPDSNDDEMVDIIPNNANEQTRAAKRRVTDIDPDQNQNKRSHDDLEAIDAARRRAEMRRSKKKQQLDSLRELRNVGMKKLKQKKNNEPVPRATKQKLVIMSPEDYDADGNFTGYASKRRKVSIDPEKLRKMRKKSRKKLLLQLERLQRTRLARNRSTTYGLGLEKEFIPYTQNIVYEYFDDPNELCDRLKLLVASKKAGNSNHDQEINSIIQELRELNIIV